MMGCDRVLEDEARVMHGGGAKSHNIAIQFGYGRHCGRRIVTAHREAAVGGGTVKTERQRCSEEAPTTHPAAEASQASSTSSSSSAPYSSSSSSSPASSSAAAAAEATEARPARARASSSSLATAMRAPSAIG